MHLSGTGKLVLQIGGVGCARRRRWADGKRQRLETLLDSFIVGLIDVLEDQRLDRLDNQCVERQRAIVRQVREVAKQRRDQEEERRTVLTDNARAWRQATEIREYLDALRRSIESGKKAPTNHEAFADWIDWATWYADFLDPLTTTPNRPEFVKLPQNTPIDALDLTRRTRSVLQHLGIVTTDELHQVDKSEFDKALGGWSYSEWNESCRVLEGLAYEVSGRYRDF